MLCSGKVDSKVNDFDTVISTQVTYHDVSDNILSEFHPWISLIQRKKPAMPFILEKWLQARSL